MGLGGISLWQLLILLLIVVLLFGTKRLRNLGSDLSSAIRDFRSGLSEGDKDEDEGKESERIEADRPEESRSEPEREKDRSESR